MNILGTVVSCINLYILASPKLHWKNQEMQDPESLLSVSSVVTQNGFRGCKTVARRGLDREPATRPQGFLAI